MNNIGPAGAATLAIPAQPNSIIARASIRGSLLIFQNPPISQCYLINFPLEGPSIPPVDINNVLVQFTYDVNNETTRSIGSNNGYGGYSSPYQSNAYSG